MLGDWSRQGHALKFCLLSYILIAYTPILGLPGKKIQQCGKRLADQAKADPEYTISNEFPIDSLHLLERRSHRYQRKLHYHPYKSHAENVVGWHPNQELMQDT